MGVVIEICVKCPGGPGMAVADIHTYRYIIPPNSSSTPGVFNTCF
jgi:hypothetical protein